MFFFFFVQAEDGIRAGHVTGVQTCALPIFIAKQVLDIGVYGVVWPHVSTVEEARNAVQACRYPRPSSAPNYEPAGMRGDAPNTAARYWGLSNQEYYQKADV